MIFQMIFAKMNIPDLICQVWCLHFAYILDVIFEQLQKKFKFMKRSCHSFVKMFLFELIALSRHWWLNHPLKNARLSTSISTVIHVRICLRKVIFKINNMNPLGNIDKFPEAAMNGACSMEVGKTFTHRLSAKITHRRAISTKKNVWLPTAM